MLNRIKKTIRTFDHYLLLGGLIALVASPIWGALLDESLFWSDIMIIMILIAGLSITYTHNKTKVRLTQYFGVTVIALTIINTFIDLSEQLENVTYYGQVIFFLILTMTMFKLILRSKKVNAEVVVNSISGYLLTGLSWTILIVVWDNAFPGSFNFSNQGKGGFFDFMYYTYVTMTTLGYGDMLPLTLAGKSFSLLISITGAFYSTIVLGMIVGKFISNQK